MISHWDPRLLFLIGFLLLLIGFLLPVLMIMQVLESTFLLNFLAYGASFLGLMLGFTGAVSFATRNRRK
jgi:hypothetical protein